MCVGKTREDGQEVETLVKEVWEVKLEEGGWEGELGLGGEVGGRWMGR